ncbi:MAG: hypothetical protein WC227_01605 [Patescibacteria group bacterium]|jgi:hypothetical protein
MFSETVDESGSDNLGEPAGNLVTGTTPETPAPSDETPARFAGWEKSTIEKVKQRADIKADILNAFNNGNVDMATEALIRAGHYLLDLEAETEYKQQNFEGTETHGPIYWRNRQVPAIIDGTASGDMQIVYLSSVDRLHFRRKDGGFEVYLCGPPSPRAKQRWELVEQAYDIYYGSN